MTAPSSIIPFVPEATLTRHLPQQPVEPRVLDLDQLLILDPRDPMAIARQFVSAKHSVDGKQALYRYRDEFFKFSRLLLPRCRWRNDTGRDLFLPRGCAYEECRQLFALQAQEGQRR